MSENGEIYNAGKNFTLPPAVTAVTNSNSAYFDLLHTFIWLSKAIVTGMEGFALTVAAPRQVCKSSFREAVKKLLFSRNIT